MKFIVLLLGASAIVTNAVPKLRSGSNCERIAPLVQTVLQNDDYVKCLRDAIALKFFGIDLNDEAKVEEFLCSIIDNVGSMPELRAALDQAGIVDDLLQLSFSYWGVTSQMALSAMRSYAKQGATKQQCRGRRGPGGYGPGGPYGLRPLPVSPEEVAQYLEAYDDLAFFSFDYENINFLGSLFQSRGRLVGFNMPKPCYCSIVKDQEQQCAILTEAVTPIWQKLMSDPSFGPLIEEKFREFEKYVGVTLVENLENDTIGLLCQIAAIQCIEDLRSFLEQHQLLEPLIELLYAGVGSILESEKRSAEYTIQSYEDFEDDDNSNGYYPPWRSSLEQYNNAKNMTALVDAIRETGLDCLEPVYVSKKIQSWCPWYEAPEYPDYLSSFF